jgi:hypothetical protein
MPLARVAVLLGASLAVAGATAGIAEGRPPPRCGNEEPDDDGQCPSERAPRRPPIEWSTWFRLGFGMKDRRDESAPEPAPAIGQDTTWEAGFGAEATLGLTARGNLRVGPWFEARGLRELVAGAEVVFTAVPKSIDLFQYRGQGILAVRAGANLDRVTAQIAYGYLAPWNLFRPSRGGPARYMIGARVAGSFTRSIEDPTDWSATLGLEIEPFGTLRYVLGIRSLY